jgi:hypothetical protein
MYLSFFQSMAVKPRLVNYHRRAKNVDPQQHPQPIAVGDHEDIAVDDTQGIIEEKKVKFI